jgi:hypothetical protein
MIMMMKRMKRMCETMVSYFVPKGWDYKEHQVKCGETDPQGGRAICEKCANDPAEMESIRRHEANVEADNAWLRSAGWGEM